jgi:SH3-like domain-containing protein
MKVESTSLSSNVTLIFELLEILNLSSSSIYLPIPHFVSLKNDAVKR